MLPKFKEQKALSAILYIAQKLIDKTPEKRADLYKLLKILYFADKEHLAKHGRPITGDFYIAMKDGPVPSRTYDILKLARGDGYFCAEDDFINTIRNSIEIKDNISIVPKATPNLEHLSKSDLMAIDSAIEKLKDKNFHQIKTMSHDQAYKQADENNAISLENVAIAGGATAGTISYLSTWFENNSRIVA